MFKTTGSAIFFLLAATPNLSFAGEYVEHTKATKFVPGEYVVTFDESVSKTEAIENENRLTSEVLKEGGEIKEIWRDALHGAALTGLSEQQARILSKMPGISLVSPNTIGASSTAQMNAPFHLDRIDQQLLPVDNIYNYTFTGAGVHAYVMDGGIRTTHQEFLTNGAPPSRATNDFDAIGGTPCGAEAQNVGYYHGTGVASIIGGTVTGVAKLIRIHGIRVSDCLNGAPTLQSMISGTNWVIAHGIKPAVVNFSTFMGSNNPQFSTAVANLINAGFFVTSAAGNTSGGNECTTTIPNSVPGVFVVAGSNIYDQQDLMSSSGPCVSAYAPDIVRAATAANDTGITPTSGTSFSAPAAAGAAALLYQSASPYIPPPNSMSTVLVSHTSNVITNTTNGAPGRLINTSFPW
jgi:subtilisin family serine protease